MGMVRPPCSVPVWASRSVRANTRRSDATCLPSTASGSCASTIAMPGCRCQRRGHSRENSRCGAVAGSEHGPHHAPTAVARDGEAYCGDGRLGSSPGFATTATRCPVRRPLQPSACRALRHRSLPHPRGISRTHEKARHDACGSRDSDTGRPGTGCLTPRSGRCRTGNRQYSGPGVARPRQPLRIDPGQSPARAGWDESNTTVSSNIARSHTR